METKEEHRLTAVEARAKSNSHRLDEVEKKQNDLGELVGIVKVLVDRQGRLEGDVKEMKNDVKVLAGKPAKRWDKLLETAITVIVSAVIGFILARIGF